MNKRPVSIPGLRRSDHTTKQREIPCFVGLNPGKSQPAYQPCEKPPPGVSPPEGTSRDRFKLRNYKEPFVRCARNVPTSCQLRRPCKLKLCSILSRENRSGATFQTGVLCRKLSSTGIFCPHLNKTRLQYSYGAVCITIYRMVSVALQDWRLAIDRRMMVTSS